ncbi:hypothetical protein RhiirA5_375497 [Rhizophagus irregularis]|uniref:Uncharacterized protein n=1 Tax=Rhizophagus irregularis TaxID=588596 RepID=A0A2N0PRB7_9GLOM|nr:hypothetical protein RhiirA5_375497 [Rhizophagus irregularis]CAB5201425.1 unnamed protein product [Rhizophagus irregularis]
MNQNTLQNKQNDHAFTESSNLQQSTIVMQPEHSSSNTYYNNVNSDPFLNDNIFHTNNNYTDQQPTSNEYIASTSQSHPLSYAPQHGHPQLPAENTSFPHNSFNITSITPSHSEILSFDIPGFKIIIVPIPSQQDNTHLNYSSIMTDNQFTNFTQFQQ